MSNQGADNQSVTNLKRWLDEPSTSPTGIDQDVVEAIHLLRPDRVQGPSVSVDDILATVTTGPFADPAATQGAATPDADQGGNAVKAPAPAANNTSWYGSLRSVGGLGIMLAAAATALLVALPQVQFGAPEPTTASVRPAAAVAERAEPPQAQDKAVAAAPVAELPVVTSAPTLASRKPTRDEAAIPQKAPLTTEPATRAKDIGLVAERQAATIPELDEQLAAKAKEELNQLSAAKAKAVERESAPKPAQQPGEAKQAKGAIQLEEPTATEAPSDSTSAPKKAAPPPAAPPAVTDSQPLMQKEEAEEAEEAADDAFMDRAASNEGLGDNDDRYEADASVRADAGNVDQGSLLMDRIKSPATKGQQAAIEAIQYFLAQGNTQQALVAGQRGLSLSKRKTKTRAALLSAYADAQAAAGDPAGASASRAEAQTILGDEQTF